MPMSGQNDKLFFSVYSLAKQLLQLIDSHFQSYQIKGNEKCYFS